MKYLKNIGIALGVLAVSIPLFSYAAPVAEIYRSLIPETTNKYYIGTTTPSNITWLGLFTQNASTTNLTVNGQGAGCAQFSSSGLLTSTGVNCGTGSGGSSFGKTWELSTINGQQYLSPTTTVPIQINSTATSTFNGALLVGTTTLPSDYVVQDKLRVQDNRNDFTDAGIENSSTGNCATSEFDALNNLTTLTNHFSAFGITGGNFSGVGCTNVPYTGFGPDSTYILNPNGNMNFALGTTSSPGQFRWYTNGYTSADLKMILTQGGFLGIGSTTPDSPLTISNNLTTFATPQNGTMLHIIRNGALNARISLDTYNNVNSNGAIYQGRTAGGTVGSPSAPSANETLAAYGGDGYGTTGFHNVSVGAFAVKAETGSFSDSSAPTYLAFFTAPSGSIAATERLRITSSGFAGLGTTTPFGLMSIGSHNGSITNPLFLVATSSTGIATTTLFSISNVGTLVNNPLLASTTALFTSGFTSYASSTLQNFTGVNATTTNATTTTLNLLNATGNITVAGLNATSSIVLTAGGATGNITGSAVGPTQVEFVTNLVNTWVMDYASSTQPTPFCSFWNIAMPNSYDGGSLQAKFFWTATTSSGTVNWGIRAGSFGNGSTIDTALSATTTVTDTLIGVNSLNVSSWSVPFTPANSVAGSQLVVFHVCRGANDTLNTNARLMEVLLGYKKRQFSD